MSESNGEKTERPLLNDVLEKHLNGCPICLDNLGRKPVPNMGGSQTVCSERLSIIQQWADTEGRVNNIVARDEYGNEAPTTNRLGE